MLTPRPGHPRRPKLFLRFLSPPPKAAVAQMGAPGALTGAPKAPKGGARDATPPGGEGNPTEGGSSRVIKNKLCIKECKPVQTVYGCLNGSTDGHSSIMWCIVCMLMLQSEYVKKNSKKVEHRKIHTCAGSGW